MNNLHRIQKIRPNLSKAQLAGIYWHYIEYKRTQFRVYRNSLRFFHQRKEEWLSCDLNHDMSMYANYIDEILSKITVIYEQST